MVLGDRRHFILVVIVILVLCFFSYSFGDSITGLTVFDHNDPSAMAGYHMEDTTADGIATDSAGNNDADCDNNNGYCPNRGNGKFGKGYSFDGNDFFTVDDSASLNPDYITVATWVSPQGIYSGGSPVIVEKDSSQIRFVLKYGDVTNDLMAAIITTTSGSKYCYATNPLLVDGGWHHVAFTYDGSNIKIYYNGDVIGTCPHTGTIVESDDDLTIGTRSGRNEYFTGVMDDLVIYDRALTENEIEQLSKSRTISFSTPFTSRRSLRYCGDGTCTPNERACGNFCLADCPAICGDGCTTHGEQCDNSACGTGQLCAPAGHVRECTCQWPREACTNFEESGLICEGTYYCPGQYDCAISGTDTCMPENIYGNIGCDHNTNNDQSIIKRCAYDGTSGNPNDECYKNIFIPPSDLHSCAYNPSDQQLAWRLNPVEICYDGRDNNCDGSVDENCDSCGDDVCDGGENCNSCYEDCDYNPPFNGLCCGDNVKQGDEECDGTDDLACPGECEDFCLCYTGGIGDGVADIYYTQGLMQIAPFTVLFSGVDSIPSTGATEIVRWDWNFDDSNSVAPEVNEDEGFLAVHTFENPGTYYVTLTVTDDEDLTASAILTVPITVVGFEDDPERETLYVSSRYGNDENGNNDCQDIGNPCLTINHAFSKMEAIPGQPDKLLLERGSEWDSNSDIEPPEPSILDAYVNPNDPSTNKPIITFVDEEEGIAWAGGGSLNAVRLNNLHIRHPVPHETMQLVKPHISGSVIDGCYIQNGGIGASSGNNAIVLQDSTITYGEISGYYAKAGDLTIRRNYFLGSASPNTDEDTPVRMHQIYLSNSDGDYENWYLGKNVFDGGYGVGNTAVKLKSGFNVFVRDSIAFRTHNSYSFGANNDKPDEPHNRNNLLENSISYTNAKPIIQNGQAAGMIVGRMDKIIVRNCKFYNNGAMDHSGQGAIWVVNDWEPTDPPFRDVRIYNNVFHGNIIPDIYVPSPNAIVDVKNNIFYSEAKRKDRGFFLLPGDNYERINSDFNTFYWEGKNVENDPMFSISTPGASNIKYGEWTDPNGFYKQDLNSEYVEVDFLDATYAIPPDYTHSPNFLKPDPNQDPATAIGKGIMLPFVFDDFDGVSRPQGLNYDIGAHEQ